MKRFGRDKAETITGKNPHRSREGRPDRIVNGDGQETSEPLLQGLTSFRYPPESLKSDSDGERADPLPIKPRKKPQKGAAPPGRGQAEPDSAHRLVGTSSLRSRYSGNGQGNRSAVKSLGAFGHGQSRFRADGAPPGEGLPGNPEKSFLGAVGITDGTAEKDVG